MTPVIRIGIEGNRSQVMRYIRDNDRAVLVSANSLWKNGKFRDSWRSYEGLDIALDSGGFVAMKLHGGYRFTVDQYVALAAEMNPTWYAQMDFCCEPEVASNAREVASRIDKTAAYLGECRESAKVIGTKAPVIVLQGWKPEDYVSGPAFDNPDFEWPDFVAVGSVCRRNLHGSDGLLAVVGKLDAKLPPHVKLHFFGVKGAAIGRLNEHPRFASMDSQAWAKATRWEARLSKLPCDGDMRKRNLEKWDSKQRELLHNPQPTFI